MRGVSFSKEIPPVPTPKFLKLRFSRRFKCFVVGSYFLESAATTMTVVEGVVDADRNPRARHTQQNHRTECFTSSPPFLKISRV